MGRTRQVTYDALRAVKETSARKSISLQKRVNGIVKIMLHNFDKRDVGTKIFLYRKTKTGIHGWKHPANRVAKAYGIEGFGYGLTAGLKFINAGNEYTFDQVPEWMSHNGFIKTEWTLNEKNIKDGCLKIDMCSMALNLLTRTDIKCDEDRDYKTYILMQDVIEFKFGMMNNDGSLVQMTDEAIRLSLRNKHIEVDNNETIEDKALIPGYDELHHRLSPYLLIVELKYR